MASLPFKKAKIDGGAPGGNKSKFYKAPGAHGRKQFLEVGQRGFMATTNFREKECVRECYNILNTYADELYGPEQLDYQVDQTVDAEAEKKPEHDGPIAAASDDDGDDEDIATKLAQDIDAAKAAQSRANKRRRFQQVLTGSSNCVFVRTALRDPVRLAEHIVRDGRGKNITRNVLRFVPVEAVCRANVLDIRNAAGQLFDRHILNAAPDTYSIVYNRRCNNDLNRDDVIRELAKLVEQKNAAFKVDLKNGNVTVLVEIVKGLCCLAVLRDYGALRKYNLAELAAVRPDVPAAEAASVAQVPEPEAASDAEVPETKTLADDESVETAEEAVEDVAKTDE